MFRIPQSPPPPGSLCNHNAPVFHRVLITSPMKNRPEIRIPYHPGSQGPPPQRVVRNSRFGFVFRNVSIILPMKNRSEIGMPYYLGSQRPQRVIRNSYSGSVFQGASLTHPMKSKAEIGIAFHPRSQGPLPQQMVRNSYFGSVFHGVSITPVLTIWCWNRALCFLDVVGCISVYGCTIVFCVTVCRLCESWSSIRTLVGAKRDGEMLPDSESRNVSHCPQVVSDVGCSSNPFASSSSLPSDYDVSNVLDHIS